MKEINKFFCETCFTRKENVAKTLFKLQNIYRNYRQYNKKTTYCIHCVCMNDLYEKLALAPTTNSRVVQNRFPRSESQQEDSLRNTSTFPKVVTVSSSV